MHPCIIVLPKMQYVNWSYSISKLWMVLMDSSLEGEYLFMVLWLNTGWRLESCHISPMGRQRKKSKLFCAENLVMGNLIRGNIFWDSTMECPSYLSPLESNTVLPMLLGAMECEHQEAVVFPQSQTINCFERQNQMGLFCVISVVFAFRKKVRWRGRGPLLIS